MRIKNRYTRPFVALGVLLSALALTAQAHPTDRMMEQLDLTEAQRQSLESLRDEFEPGRDAVQAQRDEVMALVQSGNVDAAADLAANQARERVYQRAEMHRRMAEILSPEQLAKMEEIRSNKPDRHKMGGPRGQRESRRGR